MALFLHTPTYLGTSNRAHPPAPTRTGWDKGVKGMRKGERRKLTIPPKMGYGKRGSPPEIPPNATLEFEITLVGIRR